MEVIDSSVTRLTFDLELNLTYDGKVESIPRLVRAKFERGLPFKADDIWY